MNWCSWQSVPDVDEHPAVLGDAERRAVSTEHMISAAAMSTSLLEFMYFGTGSPTIRLRGVGVRISSADFASRIHAYGLRRGDLAEPRPQLADRDQVLVG